MQKLTYFSDKTRITAGELARLAQSTKRTVQWYTEKGLLTPIEVNEEGYRFYSAEQIIDLQAIILLRELNFSIPEIKKIIEKTSSPRDLFKQKSTELARQLKKLQKSVKVIESYYSNFEKEGVLITPVTKTVGPFDMYFLEKEGPYSKIYDYAVELKSYFSKIPKNAVFLTLFPGTKYLPKKDKFKVGVVITKGMELKKNALLVKKETVPAFKSLSYIHTGSPALISMFIEQTHQYRLKHKILLNEKIGIHELEFYKKSALNDIFDPDGEVSEINIPIL